MYSYESPLKKNEVLVGFYQHSSHPVYQASSGKMEELSNRFGFTFLENPSLQQNQSSFLLKHCIVLTDVDSIFEACQKYDSLLSFFQTMSLGIVYRSEEAFLEASKLVEDLKTKYKGKINFLRPNEFDSQGRYYASEEKVLDNSICDTVRVKYIPKKIEFPSLEEVVNKYWPFFKSCGEVYTNLKLYHRAPHDGFFAIRCPYGILVTATKTDKSRLSKERISLIHSYDEASNHLIYSGKFLPSSDAVEASIVFQNVPSVESLVHTHASDRFTRNPVFSSRIQIPKMSYGEAALGHAVGKVIPNFLNSFLIMEDHGEVFAFSPLEDLSSYAQRVLEICELSEKEQLVLR